MNRAESSWWRAGVEGTAVRPSVVADGFTLIELLVVMAIIGILSSLLLPSLGAAKRRAHTTRCISNLKQFGLALQLYAGDHNDALPPNLDGPNKPLGQTWVEGWLGLPGPDCTNLLYLDRSLIGPYVKEPALWQCPSARQVTVGSMTAGAHDFSQLLPGFTGAEPCRHYLPASGRHRPSGAQRDAGLHGGTGGDEWLQEHATWRER
jgi:prepilin-type N-terminal cleavage/methylation domain-containing protein